MTDEEMKRELALRRLDRKKARKEEWEKIKSLGPKARIGYLWDYYKWVLGLVVGCGAVINVIFTMVNGIGVEQLLNIVILNADYYGSGVDELVDDFTEYIGGLKNKQEISADSSMTVVPDSYTQTAMAVTVKITVYLQSGQLDLFLAPPYIMDFEQSNGFLAPLDDLLSSEKISELAGRGDLYYAYDVEIGETETSDVSSEESSIISQTSEGIDSSEFVLNTNEKNGQHIYAVRVDDASVLDNYQIYNDDEQVWFALCVNDIHQDTSLKFLNFLLGEDYSETEEA